MFRTIALAICMTCLLAVSALAQQPQTQPMGPGMMGAQPGSPMMNGQAAAIPNLVGTWQADSFQLHHKTQGFIKDTVTATLVVKEQNGRVFHGTVEWAGKATGKDSFSGVIDKDNVSFYLAGHAEGLRICKMEGPDAFTYYYIVPGGANPRAGFVEYKRMK